MIIQKESHQNSMPVIDLLMPERRNQSKLEEILSQELEQFGRKRKDEVRGKKQNKK